MEDPTPPSALPTLLDFPLWLCLLLALSLPFSMAAPSLPPSPAPAPSPVNITQIIENAGQFATFLSLLTATNVEELFQSQANKTTTGITIFAPTDKAFSSLQAGIISKLTAQQKIILLEFHALSAFYPLSALQQATDPVTPTLATDNAGVGKYTVNVTNQQGTVVISTGLTNAALISTLYNTVPCGVFAINQVLLPEEIFGLPAPSPAPSPYSPASSPSAFSPANTVASSSPASPFGPGTTTGGSPPGVSAGPAPDASSAPSLHFTGAVLCTSVIVFVLNLYLL